MNKIVILVFLISVSSSANSQENLDKFVIDTVKGLGSSFILSSSELEKELNSTLSNIESNCCSENFEKKEELLALSKEMKECKNNKCYENIISTLDFRKSDKYLLQQNITRCIHLEPTIELYDQNILFDYLAAWFHSKRGYTAGLLPYLQRKEAEGFIKIINNIIKVILMLLH